MAYAQNINIGAKSIGIGKDIFLAAEVGTMHNGSLETAKKLVDAAVFAGLDAVKFQIIGAEEIHSDRSQTYTYKTYDGQTKSESIVEMLKKYQFTLDQWKELKEYADQKGTIFFVSVDYPGAIEIGEAIGSPAYKICAWDLNYYPFIRKVARLQKPVVFDMGTVEEEGVKKILGIFQEERNDKIILLHSFHTDNYEEMNMKSIVYLRDTFGVLAGYSAPNRNFDIDVLALAFDPVMIEKRLTLNKSDSAHHHALALEPEEMRQYVQEVRKLQSALGKEGVFPSKGDLEGTTKYFRRIVATCGIKKGEKFTPENIDCKRPSEGGLDPALYETVLGNVAKQDFKENEPISIA